MLLELEIGENKNEKLPYVHGEVVFLRVKLCTT